MNNPLKSQIAANRERFNQKFGKFYVSIDSKTKAIRIVDIENGIKVNGEDGSEIECVASGDIVKFNKESDTSLLQTEIAAVEKLKKDLLPEFDIYNEWENGINQALSKVVDLLKGGIEE